jgi:hypothetical protein
MTPHWDYNPGSYGDGPPQGHYGPNGEPVDPWGGPIPGAGGEGGTGGSSSGEGGSGGLNPGEGGGGVGGGGSIGLSPGEGGGGVGGGGGGNPIKIDPGDGTDPVEPK